jgi:hypothetical protein
MVTRKTALVYFFTSVVLSYTYLFKTTKDWDFFISLFSIEAMGFLENLKPIDWSYLMCGGVTRLGDPQSFSYSPFLLFPMLFGGFWGVKFYTIASITVGLYYSDKLFILLNGVESKARYLFSFGLIFSNFFISHISEGHITFTLYFWAIAAIYHSFKLFMGQYSYKESLSLIVFIALIFLSGFYAVALYFIFPIVMSFIITLILFSIRIKAFSRSLALMLASSIIGLILSHHKIWGVLEYQLNNPRTVQVLDEKYSILEFIVYFFTPLVGEKFLGIIGSGSLWSVWEKTAFSPISIIIIVYFVLIRKDLIERVKCLQVEKKILFVFFTILFLLGMGLSLGDYYGSPYSLLKNLTNNSIRVPFRFSFVSLFALFGLFALLYRNGHFKSQKQLIISLGVVFINTLCFVQFNTFLYRFEDYTRTQNVKLGQYNKLTYVPVRDSITSSMYPALNLGIGVYNCYMPLNRQQLISGEFNFDQREILKLIPFIVAKNSCLNDSYFSQENIILDQSCKGEICFNFNDINLKNDKFIFYKSDNKYCINI